MRLLKQTLSRIAARFRTVNALLRGELTLASSSLSVVVIRVDGSREDLGVVCRKKVTQAFVKRLCAQMAANFSAGDSFKYHDSGTGTTAASNTDTALQTATGGARVAGTQADSSTGTTGNYTTVAIINYVNTLSITEHGIFNDSSSGTLLDRNVFTAIDVDSGDGIQFTYELTINPES